MKRIAAALALAAALGCGTPPEAPVEDTAFATLDAVNNSSITVEVRANRERAFVDPARREVITVEEAWSGGLGLYIEVVWQDSLLTHATLFAEHATPGGRYEVVASDSAAHLFKGR